MEIATAVTAALNVGGVAAGQKVQLSAVKASGAIVRVEPNDFLAILNRQTSPLVIHALRGVVVTKHRYLTSYKGLMFFTQSPGSLQLPSDAEMIEATKIWMPA